MGVIIFDKNGKEYEVNYMIDANTAIATGKYSFEDPTKRKKVKVIKPEEEKPAEKSDTKEEAVREEPKEEEKEETKASSWRDEMAKKSRR